MTNQAGWLAIQVACGQLGLPTNWRGDLDTVREQLNAPDAPLNFGFGLRTTGAELFLPTRPNDIEWARVQKENQKERLFFWYRTTGSYTDMQGNINPQGYLQKMSLEEMRTRLVEETQCLMDEGQASSRALAALKPAIEGVVAAFTAEETDDPAADWDNLEDALIALDETYKGISNADPARVS